LAFGILFFGISQPATPRAAAAAVTLTIDTARPAQEILGFGASGAWWSPEVGGLPEAQRREILRLLYDKKTGIGLTIYRHNLGAGTLNDKTIQPGLRRVDSVVDPKTGRIDWSRDANARRVMREAVAAGAEQVILFVNSPPVTMTVNGHGRCTKNPEGKPPASNLAPERYDDFAAYLGEVTEHFLRVEKLPIVAVSPINEPGHPWDKDKQEGCFYTPDQAAAVFKKVLAEFKRRDLPVRVEPTESESWKAALAYYEAIARDPELRAALTDYCVHSYASNPDSKQKLRAWLGKNCPGARLHMSEWCEMKLKGDGRDINNGALPMARTMIEDFATGGARTWQYWRAASRTGSHDGLVYYDAATGAVTTTKLYSVLGQFSRYMTKGTVVLASQSTDKQAPAMAARLPDGRVAVVCVNLSDAQKTLSIQFPKNETWRPRLRALTDAKNNGTETAIAAAADAVTLPAKSVVTIIFQKG